MATPTKWGNEFIVNSLVPGEQFGSRVTGLADGGFVAVWTGDVAGSFEIRGQIFHAGGSKRGAEFALNTTTNEDQFVPKVAALPDGRFVAVWTDRSEGLPYYDVRGQIFNADGTKSGGEFIVNTQTQGYQGLPCVQALSDGRFVAAWSDALSGPHDIHAQMFNSDGTRSGVEFLVNSSTTDYQDDAAIAELSGGRFVITWSDANISEIRGQIFNSEDGSSHGAEFAVNTSSSGNYFPTITALEKGGFVASWAKSVGGALQEEIRAQVLDDNGSKVGPEFTVNTTIIGDQDVSALAALPDGRFVAVWEDSSETGGDPSGAALRAQVFNTDGAKSGAEFLVNTTTPLGQGDPSIAVLADGRFVVSWTDQSRTAGDHQSGDIRGQIFDPRESGVDLHGTPLSDVWIGSKFDDGMKGGGGADHLEGRNGNDVLRGEDGNDTLIGGFGIDTLDGGGGDDTAVIAQGLGQSVVTDLGDRIVVSGPYGLDTLISIEHLQFTDGTVAPNDGNPLFDTLRYMNQNLDVFHAGANALEHFNTFGWHEGRDPNTFFSVKQYLDANPDVKASGINPLEHYHQTGWHDGRDPSVRFDTKLYLIHNPDVAAAGIDPLEHFLQHGISEGRDAYAAIGPSIVNGFDAQHYLMSNRDVAAAGVDPLQHYQMFGWHEGRNPNGWFDTAGYLAHYADVAAAGVNPLEHYAQFGWKEGRDPSAAFDTLGYLAANPDVAAAGVNPLEHFLTFGAYEGRNAVNDGVWH